MIGGYCYCSNCPGPANSNSPSLGPPFFLPLYNLDSYYGVRFLVCRHLRPAYFFRFGRKQENMDTHSLARFLLFFFLFLVCLFARSRTNGVRSRWVRFIAQIYPRSLKRIRGLIGAAAAAEEDAIGRYTRSPQSFREHARKRNRTEF